MNIRTDLVRKTRKTRAAIGIAAMALCAPLLAGEADKAPHSADTGKEKRILAFEAPTLDSPPVHIGSRRELFVDNTIIGKMTGDLKRHLFELQPATTERTDVALRFDADWEDSECVYITCIKDGNLIRLWYRALHRPLGATAYAEGRNGIGFKRPKLGIYMWKESKENNILFDDRSFKDANGRVVRQSANFAPFLDQNPDAAPEAKYKGFGGQAEGCGIGFYTFTSPDGLNWKLHSPKPIVDVTKYRCDSLNQGFWDPLRKRYTLYLRGLRNEKGEMGIKAAKWKRCIFVSYSQDFVTWTEPEHLIYFHNDGNSELQHLYTNEIKPYKRAPHIYLGFPALFSGFVEPMLMASRDSLHFFRWMDGPVIPKEAPCDRNISRGNYLSQEMLEIPGEPNTYSMYATENYGNRGPHADGSVPRLRRFTIRKDGFVSVRAGAEGGEFVTKPLIFSGNSLTINYDARSSDAGQVTVAILDGDRKPVRGFASEDSDFLVSDKIDRQVTWKGRSDLGSLAGKPVHLCFRLRNADLFSFKFEDKQK